MKHDKGEGTIMRKWIICLLSVCLLSCLVTGCKKEEEKKGQDVKSVAIDYVTDDLPDKGQSFSKEEKEKIKTGITMWATGFLIVDSDSEKQQKNIIDDSLYSSIASEEDQKKLQKDREKLYDGSTVKVSSVKVEVNDAYKVEYDGQKLGRVKCKVNVKGTKGEKEFKRNYTIEMVITYEDSVSVYEIGSISWKS